jgi:hypothetical protein
MTHPTIARLDALIARQEARYQAAVEADYWAAAAGKGPDRGALEEMRKAGARLYQLRRERARTTQAA